MPFYVSGTGSVTPVAISPRSVQVFLNTGATGYAKLEGRKWADLEKFRTNAGGVIEGALLEQLKNDNRSSGSEFSELQRCESFAFHACRQAFTADHGFDPARVGLVLGTNFGNASAISPMFAASAKGEPFADLLETYSFGGITKRLALALGIEGPIATLSLSCASGVAVIAQAERMFAIYDIDAVLACSVDEMSVYVFSGLHSLRAMSPENVVKPWDVNRKGTVFSEGAAALLLTRENRGSRIAVKATYQNNDGFHLSAPDTSAHGITTLIAKTLEIADLEPRDICFVNLHGTATVYNDRIETAAIRNVFGDWGFKVPMTSNKGALGHLMGAAGLVETISAIETLQDGVLPPTANLEDRDPDILMNVVTESTPIEGVFALKNSFGIGGANACVILERLQ
ncbi:MAG: beta-ketoacyl-ACP synthase II [Planctomycetota bacterium]